MKALYMAVACPICGSDVKHINGNAMGTLSVAIVACRSCRKEFEVTARLTRHRAIA